ncbi:MAG: hypothetical protein M3P82_06705 [Bacteroidota bacterium]|nr:hypothetical protein [Bacteroidota bacterium]
MKENIKKDYLKYLFHKTFADLSRFNISHQESEFINKLFNKLCHSENVLVELYILSNIKNLRNVGNYLLFIYKKMEDNVINFDNLSHNLNTDAEFIENEILNYLSNPKLIGSKNNLQDEEKKELFDKKFYKVDLIQTEREGISKEPGVNMEADIEEDDDILRFKKNYLELIQSEESETEIVFDLPVTKDKEGEKIFLDAPLIENSDNFDNIVDLENIESITNIEETIEHPASSRSENPDRRKEEEIAEQPEEEIVAELFIKEAGTDQSESGIEDIASEIETDDERYQVEEERVSAGIEEKVHDAGNDPETVDDNKISLSDEIIEELNSPNESEDNEGEEEQSEPESQGVMPPTNESFTDYENELRDKNIFLNHEFDKMIGLVNLKNTDEDERMLIINNIIDTGSYLESISRSMSLELISNIYQTITLSFEKIADGRYDLSESTLNLFKNGLTLVLSLIKGDDYFGYKDILKSIENIRNSLIEEKERREKYLKRLQEKLHLETNLSRQFPEEIQKENLKHLKKLIKDAEAKFNMLEKITGEYQIYEALRSLSGNLNNFKEMVKLARELQLMKIVQLAEASYIFTKFLQNYRINPVATETKEIFGYIIYNLKSLAVGKPVEDINLFISYLNDPVKIFSKTEMKK